MAYSDRFVLADNVFTHLDSFVPTLTDPFLISRYIGFASVTAVTVYELAIKDIFIEFSMKKHRVFGAFTQAYFRRLNGRIGIKDIDEQHIMRYGDKYRDRFEKNLDRKEKELLIIAKLSIKSSYGNLITWRNQFAHEGKIPNNATWSELVNAYPNGKEVVHCLGAAMKR